jgi:energy-coupling factor transporter ATP-binding protein EcfA2
VAIATNCPLLERELGYLVQDVRQDFPVSARVNYEAILEDNRYRIREDGRQVAVEHEAVRVLDYFHLHSYAKAMALLPAGTALLHAASGRHAGKRFLLIGESGVGKTTLIMHLAWLGLTVEGDELAALTPLGVSALPRRFHVKSWAFGELPWLEAQADRFPRYDNSNGTYVYSVSPSELGFAWNIPCGPVDAVFYLEANHGGRPRIETIARYRMAELAMSQARLSDRRDRSWIGPLCAVVEGAAAYKLVVGELDSTAKLLLKKLSETTVQAKA